MSLQFVRMTIVTSLVRKLNVTLIWEEIMITSLVTKLNRQWLITSLVTKLNVISMWRKIIVTSPVMKL